VFRFEFHGVPAGPAHVGHDDEWHLPQAGTPGIDFEAPLVTLAMVLGRDLYRAVVGSAALSSGGFTSVLL
jgi:hypothetical protein